VTVLAGDVVTITAYDRSYRIVNPGPGRVGSKLALGEPYERKLLQDIHQRGLSGTAFDVGAHIGNHTLYLAAVCGFAVHAWEPHEKSLAQLDANLALNPGLDVTVHRWAAGREEGRGKLTAGMWLEFDPSRDGAAMQIDRGHVPVHRIDDHLDVDDLAVVKVDVEGMEADVLAGMGRHLERCRPVVYAETHTRTAAHRIAKVLHPFGYSCTGQIGPPAIGSPMTIWEAA
jgi:FkbM family methyltransferase